MQESYLIFSSIAVLGIIIVILGFKFQTKTRKVVDTFGAIIFHVGVFGILYYKVQINIFISLVLLVISLFLLIDPLRIRYHVNPKIYRLFGYLFLLASAVFSLEHFTGFPVWLWVIPVVIYLIPYLITPLKSKSGLIAAVAWIIVVGYFLVVGYLFYTTHYENKEVNVSETIRAWIKKDKTPSELHKQLDFEKDFQTDNVVNDGNKTQDTVEKKQPVSTTSTTTVTTQKTTEPTTTAKQTPTNLGGPYLQSLKQADETFIKLKNSYDELQTKYDDLILENTKLKDAIKKLDPKASRLQKVEE
jgi:hypothetical protein